MCLKAISTERIVATTIADLVASVAISWSGGAAAQGNAVPSAGAPGANVASTATSAAYPGKPVHLLIGFPPGTAGDVLARLVRPRLTEMLGQPVIVENRAGASGSLAIERVASAPADGHTLLLQTSSSTALPALHAKLPYDLQRDLAPVSLLASGPYLLVVHPSVPARSASELIALARAQPGKLNYGSSGPGSAPYLAGELFKSMAKINVVEVSYKGGAESAVANASGEVSITFPSIPPAQPLLSQGKLRALAVTGAQRSPLMPALPTVNESGLPGYDRSGWYGVVAPAGVPKEILARLHAVLGAIAGAADMKEVFNRQGLEPRGTTPAQFSALIQREIAVNTRLIQATRARQP